MATCVWSCEDWFPKYETQVGCCGRVYVGPKEQAMDWARHNVDVIVNVGNKDWPSECRERFSLNLNYQAR